MYIALYLALLGAGVWLAVRGLQRRRVALAAGGATLALATLAFFGLLDFWGEMLWFESVGHAARFWTEIGVTVATVLAGALAAAAAVFVLTRSIPRESRTVHRAALLAALGLGILWGLASWDEALLFFQRVHAGAADPVLGFDVGFYLFALPFYTRVVWLATWAVVIALAASLAAALELTADRAPVLRESVPVRPFVATAVGAALVFAAHQALAVFHLLYSELGVVTGAGWTDIHVRLPAHVALAAIALVAAVALAVPRMRNALAFGRPSMAGLAPLAAAGGLLAGLWFVALGIVPSAFQWLVVEPNEITYEAPYIARNIDFTRRGFRLDRVDERQFAADRELTQAILRDNAAVVDNVRLWDWRALDAVYAQFQEIRLYYEFLDVDIDRYTVGDRYRQVMVSARELEPRNLPADSQTFVNLRFKYTHGFGVTLAPVSEFTADGLPNLLVKDIPPVASAPELEVTEPRIYYGERTRTPVVVNAREPEFDYPSGEENVYFRYDGTGGVQMTNLWRKFVFGWMFDGTQLLVSSYPTSESRMMFHREIRERVRTLAPFLALDDDPYVVLSGGRLYWIVDAYTTSEWFPYSAPLRATTAAVGPRARGQIRALYGANYVRNSVKAVVDAYEGSVDLYVFEPDDPLIRAWSRAFPGLFKPEEAMPAPLRAHVRYPAGFLLAQGLVYAKYHMTDPEVFYNQEDLWVQATEKHYGGVEPVDPYYVMWQLPGSERAEFALILPFTPKNRQVLIGWIAGLSDGENYGRFLAYKFPKERRVLGPQQVETKIDQDRFLSAQLSLWDQRGSNVIRGNVLAIPLDDTLVYVEPIYLEAETAAYPELRLVVVMHGDRMSYGETLDVALSGLFEDRAARAGLPPAIPGTGERTVAEEARDAFEAYLDLQSQGRFMDAARELERLREALDRLAGGESQAGGASAGTIARGPADAPRPAPHQKEQR